MVTGIGLSKHFLPLKLQSGLKLTLRLHSYWMSTRYR